MTREGKEVAVLLALIAGLVAACVYGFLHIHDDKTHLLVWDEMEELVYEHSWHPCLGHEVRGTIYNRFPNQKIDSFWSHCGKGSKTEVFLVPQRSRRRQKPQELK